ncbi:hypothetical protein IAG44_42745 [Streptomyces roseirectus]|uniref:Uncharacterized protein n=1 Tax=Streptomyces roseirectus TaxID=2768066 RepID=A0A7H0IRQ2_9ACTN|nr:hypothetical protein IAG44_42745 [Streptomyces roseirectus]
MPAADRLLVTGGNGGGKPPLLSVLADRLPAQDTVFQRPERAGRGVYALSAGAGRVPLHSLGLMPERDLDTPVGRLSVDQHRRLTLALLPARPPQLPLDEPTNRLPPPAPHPVVRSRARPADRAPPEAVTTLAFRSYHLSRW